MRSALLVPVFLAASVFSPSRVLNPVLSEVELSSHLVPAVAGKPETASHTFAVVGGQFQYDGKPYQILSGEMHYPRVPRAYWRNRFQMARAMGLNTITTYVFWNLHEPRPGVYDFAGQNDVAEYIREAQQEGLNVILRPGPYVCAEWDLGGYPSWLLKDRNLTLRSTDPKYLAAMNEWFARLSKELSPLLLHNGGPIIAIQVENEYGSFGNDHSYMRAVKDGLLKSGLAAPDTLLYTADGPEQVPNGSLPELPAVINFGTGDAKQAFDTLKKLRTTGPYMTGEYWAGWFDHWGEHHHTTAVAANASEYEWMLQQGYSVSMYMFHGGTSFGFMNGANSNGSNYEPDTTSYDYDAPLNESGQPTPKFTAFREAITRVTAETPPTIPPSIPAQTYPVSPHPESASLWSNLPAPLESDKLLTMEDLDQSYGYILYRTEIPNGASGQLTIDGLHDYAQIYIDRKLIGTLDRRLGQSSLALPPTLSKTTLDILVENSGRVNFTKVIRTERKGITGSVTIGNQQPQHWQIYSLPISDLAALHFTQAPCEGPCFYRYSLTAQSSSGAKTPIPDTFPDTFLDTHTLSKGVAFLNGKPLGRFWSIGPQFTLYTPGPWLRTGQNEIVLFDLQGSKSESLKTTNHADYGPTVK
ncbi:glycoside hydrolase family 35 protein [Occallatibacter savannae]|uniref:glycoside hydrolase family 35 protein n=1 Tax=Occallatibacter savannae TaxID=1002691 RepID=UPI000D6867E6|nr:beta-galactosidase family protein [Occallatibacter savannae]